MSNQHVPVWIDAAWYGIMMIAYSRQVRWGGSRPLGWQPGNDVYDRQLGRPEDWLSGQGGGKPCADITTHSTHQYIRVSTCKVHVAASSSQLLVKQMKLHWQCQNCGAAATAAVTATAWTATAQQRQRNTDSFMGNTYRDSTTPKCACRNTVHKNTLSSL